MLLLENHKFLNSVAARFLLLLIFDYFYLLWVIDCWCRCLRSPFGRPKATLTYLMIVIRFQAEAMNNKEAEDETSHRRVIHAREKGIKE